MYSNTNIAAAILVKLHVHNKSRPIMENYRISSTNAICTLWGRLIKTFFKCLFLCYNDAKTTYMLFWHRYNIENKHLKKVLISLPHSVLHTLYHDICISCIIFLKKSRNIQVITITRYSSQIEESRYKYNDLTFTHFCIHFCSKVTVVKVFVR